MSNSTAVLAPVPVALIERRIHSIRGHRVMLDSDLAELYDVPTKAFNQAVKRNVERFPDDFMIQLTAKEELGLRSQIVTSKRGGRRYRPYAFTEQGIAMLSSVLSSPRAIQVNITIMRAFVKLREIAVTHKDLLAKVREMEKKYDDSFQFVFRAIEDLMEPPTTPPKRKIGFEASASS